MGLKFNLGDIFCSIFLSSGWKTFRWLRSKIAFFQTRFVITGTFACKTVHLHRENLLSSAFLPCKTILSL